MTVEKIAPVAGMSLDTAPRSWAGGPAVVSVTCTAVPWGATQLTLESQEVRADGFVGNWTTVATFQADEVRELSLPPGRTRWQATQPMHDAHRRSWSVDVAPRTRRAAA